jgi:hypothetical protein
MVSARLPPGGQEPLVIGEIRRNEDHQEEHPLGCKKTGRTPCGDEPERTMPPCSPFGARMQWPEPAHTEQSPARSCA